MILEGLQEKQLFSDSFPFSIIVNDKENFYYPPHWHNAVELIYSIKNKCYVNVNNTDYVLSENDILYIAAGDVHSFNIHNSKGNVFIIQFDFSELYGFTGNSSEKLFFSKTEIISYSKDKALHNELKMNIDKIIDEYNKKDFAYQLFLNASILNITAILSRTYFRNNDTAKNNNKAYGFVKLDKAFKYIEENYQYNISLKDVSKAAGFSEYHFSRVFKKITDKNFHSYLNEYRIKKAEKLLLDGDITITQISGNCGFNSMVTFNRIFKQIKGCSPTAYMKMRI